MLQRRLSRPRLIGDRSDSGGRPLDAAPRAGVWSAPMSAKTTFNANHLHHHGHANAVAMIVYP